MLAGLQGSTYRRALLALVPLLLTACSDEPGESQSGTTPQPSKVRVVARIGNVTATDGFMRVCLYDDPHGWAQDMDAHSSDHALATLQLPATPESTTADFGEVPPGGYAITVHHDRNDNGFMDMKGMVIELPVEPYGFSRNYDPVRNMGAPEFADCRFEATGERIEVPITLR